MDKMKHRYLIIAFWAFIVIIHATQATTSLMRYFAFSPVMENTPFPFMVYFNVAFIITAFVVIIHNLRKIMQEKYPVEEESVEKEY